MADWFYWEKKSLYLSIQLQPGASSDSLVGPLGKHLKIRLTSPPLEGRANKHLIKFLAKSFKVAQQQVTIEQGKQSKIKLVCIYAPKNLDILNENYFRK